MLNKFSILLHYQDKLVIAQVQQRESQMEWEGEVTFPDGFHNIFYAYEKGDWYEDTLGPSLLAKEVGQAIEHYLTYKTEPKILLIHGRVFIMLAVPGINTTMYQIYIDELVGTIYRNEMGEWEGDDKLTEAIVKVLGGEIDQKEM